MTTLLTVSQAQKNIFISLGARPWGTLITVLAKANKQEQLQVAGLAGPLIN